MRVLLTRPREDAEPLAGRLHGIGIETIIEPLLAIEIDRAAAVDLEGVQAILATSANGVRALAALSPRRDLPVLAVGDATALKEDDKPQRLDASAPAEAREAEKSKDA